MREGCQGQGCGGSEDGVDGPAFLCGLWRTLLVRRWLCSRGR